MSNSIDDLERHREWLDRQIKAGKASTATPVKRVAFVRHSVRHEVPMQDFMRRIAAYLDGTEYFAVRNGSEITIEGHDVAGWTLDGYVLPRLASGLIFAEEVTR